MRKIIGRTLENTNVDIEKMWEKLHSYGIYSEADLDREIKRMGPLDISCMAGKPLLDNNKSTTTEEV